MKKYLYRTFQWIFKGIPVTKVEAGITTCEPMQRLAGKKILVTGGSKGIGYHIAQRFQQEGALVVIAGRNKESLETAAKEIGCQWIQFDINQISSLPNLVEQAAEMLGGINGLVNNAGVCNIDHGFVNVSEASYDEQFLTNVKSPFFLTQAFVKYVQQHHAGTSGVLFITSERGLYPDDAPYGMSKAALNNIVAGLARQFATEDIRFNGIAPGVTADTKNHPEMLNDLYLKGNVGKRFFIPNEIAEVATFLMSDASKCISGEIIPCDQANYYK